MMPNNKRAVRRVFREDVKDFLLDAILSGDLKPGERVVESRIARELGVSQGPVREALRDLELLGFVESQPFRGASVRKFSNRDLVEIYPVRAALEGVAAREAAQCIDEDVLRDLESSLDAMRSAARDNDRASLIHADVQFHRTVVEASGNRILLHLWQTTSLFSSTTVSVALSHWLLMDLAERHTPIISALRDRDPARAEATMRSHIEELASTLHVRPSSADAPNLDSHDTLLVAEESDRP